jgi:hypothetical protein
MQLEHRIFENGLETAIGFPLSKGSINPRIMDLGTAFVVFLDRQFFPLASKVKKFENIVEKHMQAHLQCRFPVSNGKVGQDKLAGLLCRQLRWNPLKLLAFCHYFNNYRHAKNMTLDSSLHSRKHYVFTITYRKFHPAQKPATSSKLGSPLPRISSQIMWVCLTFRAGYDFFELITFGKYCRIWRRASR